MSPFLLLLREMPLKHPPSRQGGELHQVLCCHYSGTYGFHLTGWAAQGAKS